MCGSQNTDRWAEAKRRMGREMCGEMGCYDKATHFFQETTNPLWTTECCGEHYHHFLSAYSIGTSWSTIVEVPAP